MVERGVNLLAPGGRHSPVEDRFDSRRGAEAAAAEAAAAAGAGALAAGGAPGFGGDHFFRPSGDGSRPVGRANTLGGTPAADGAEAFSDPWAALASGFGGSAGGGGDAATAAAAADLLSLLNTVECLPGGVSGGFSQREIAQCLFGPGGEGEGGTPARRAAGGGAARAAAAAAELSGVTGLTGFTGQSAFAAATAGAAAAAAGGGGGGGGGGVGGSPSALFHPFFGLNGLFDVAGTASSVGSSVGSSAAASAPGTVGGGAGFPGFNLGAPPAVIDAFGPASATGPGPGAAGPGLGAAPGAYGPGQVAGPLPDFDTPRKRDAAPLQQFLSFDEARLRGRRGFAGSGAGEALFLHRSVPDMARGADACMRHDGTPAGDGGKPVFDLAAHARARRSLPPLAAAAAGAAAAAAAAGPGARGCRDGSLRARFAGDGAGDGAAPAEAAATGAACALLQQLQGLPFPSTVAPRSTAAAAADGDFVPAPRALTRCHTIHGVGLGAVGPPVPAGDVAPVYRTCIEWGSSAAGGGGGRAGGNGNGFALRHTASTDYELRDLRTFDQFDFTPFDFPDLASSGNGRCAGGRHTRRLSAIIPGSAAGRAGGGCACAHGPAAAAAVPVSHSAENFGQFRSLTGTDDFLLTDQVLNTLARELRAVATAASESAPPPPPPAPPLLLATPHFPASRGSALREASARAVGGEVSGGDDGAISVAAAAAGGGGSERGAVGGRSPRGADSDCGSGSTPSPPTPEKSSLTEEEMTAEVIAEIPRNAQGELLSYGSRGHAAGACKPCVFFHNPAKKCKNGPGCLFCHYEHPVKKRVRVSRKRRAQQQNAAASASQQFSVDQTIQFTT